MDTIRIYAAADLHGRSSCVDTVARHANRADVHAVVLAGDLVHYRWGHAILGKLAALPQPVFFIRGNTDPGWIDHQAVNPDHQMYSLNLIPHQCRGHRIAGVSGTLPIPFRSRIGWSEVKRLERLAAMIDSRSILVAHPPPWGLRDRVAGRWHAGSRGLRRLIAAKSPAILICGHIHEAAGIAWLGRTLVVNCALGKQGRGAIISYDGQRRPRARML
jgi:hypothetical protein